MLGAGKFDSAYHGAVQERIVMELIGLDADDVTIRPRHCCAGSCDPTALMCEWGILDMELRTGKMPCTKTQTVYDDRHAGKCR
jgi:hypothetical protein